MNRETMAQHDLIYTAWPKLNKQDKLADYVAQLECRAGYGLSFEPCKVIDTVILTCDEWDDFTHGLLDNREWLKDRGGCDSLATVRPGVERLDQLTAPELADWRNQSYRLAVLVVRPGETKHESVAIYVDPQGYDYARYVGFYVYPCEPEPGRVTCPPNLPVLADVMDTTLGGVRFADRVMAAAL